MPTFRSLLSDETFDDLDRALGELQQLGCIIIAGAGANLSHGSLLGRLIRDECQRAGDDRVRIGEEHIPLDPSLHCVKREALLNEVSEPSSCPMGIFLQGGVLMGHAVLRQWVKFSFELRSPVKAGCWRNTNLARSIQTRSRSGKGFDRTPTLRPTNVCILVQTISRLLSQCEFILRDMDGDVSWRTVGICELSLS